MTQAIICDGKCGETIVELKGHAGYNPGNDIVCSAISAFTYALINLLRNKDAAIYELFESPGHIRIRFKANHWKEYKEFFSTGLNMIADSYPKNLEVHEL